MVPLSSALYRLSNLCYQLLSALFAETMPSN
jgi:hypothetical protein